MSQIASPLTLGISQSDFDVLAKSALLSGLSIKELSALLERLDQVAVAQGTVVVREGEEGDYLYFVIEGTAKISRRKLELRVAGPGDHFGELAVVGVRRRSATVTALTTMRLARLSLGGYHSFSHSHPSAALHFVQAVVSSLGDELVGMTDTMGRILQMRSLPRHSTIKVQIDDEPPRSVPLGTEVRELLPGAVDGALVVAGLTDLRPVSLATGLVADTRLNPLTMAVWEGREIYRRIQELFREHGIRFAPRRVIVDAEGAGGETGMVETAVMAAASSTVTHPPVSPATGRPQANAGPG